MHLTALAWTDPANDVGPHFHGELGVEGALKGFRGTNAGQRPCRKMMRATERFTHTLTGESLNDAFRRAVHFQAANCTCIPARHCGGPVIRIAVVCLVQTLFNPQSKGSLQLHLSLLNPQERCSEFWAILRSDCRRREE